MWRRGGGAVVVSGGDDVSVLGQTEQMSCADDDFEAVFVTETGVEQRVPWWRLPEWSVSSGARCGRSRRIAGSGTIPAGIGLRRWAAGSGFGSWVERDHLVALDFDASVAWIVSQPFWLFWTSGDSKRRRHAPDFLVRSVDGAVWCSIRGRRS